MKFDWKPHPKQLEFFESKERCVSIITTPCRKTPDWIKKLFLEPKQEDKMLEGYIRNLVGPKKFAFITCESDNTDYFFHKEDFNGHWIDLETDYLLFAREGKNVRVQFEKGDSKKGPRARNVSRVDYPNQSEMEVSDEK